MAMLVKIAMLGWYDAMYSGRGVPTFQKNYFTPLSEWITDRSFIRHLPWWLRWPIPLQQWHISKRLHNITSHRTAIFTMLYGPMYCFNPLKADVHLKTAQNFSSYLTENTTQLYFKDSLILFTKITAVCRLQHRKWNTKWAKCKVSSF